MVRAARLWVSKSPEGREIETGLRHPTTGKLSLSTQQKMGICTLNKSGKDKVVKGEEYAQPFICSVQDTVGL